MSQYSTCLQEEFNGNKTAMDAAVLPVNVSISIQNSCINSSTNKEYFQFSNVKDNCWVCLSNTLVENTRKTQINILKKT